MVPLLSELWRWICYLLSPEDHTAGARHAPGPGLSPAASALAGLAKTVLWAVLAVLAGLGLGRLNG